MTVDELSEDAGIGIQVAYKRVAQAFKHRGGLLKIPGVRRVYVVSKPRKSYQIIPIDADATGQLIDILVQMIGYVCGDCEAVVSKMIVNLQESE